ncbi:hypothetical protein A3709_20640 [Halioglobus sp. HI00S01]|uniref:hypothetical protein n=1 Tax=Halioglobus sp. HI00S01 TaxID=1822214 RepID=UPI0007C250E2|nr:hypothetical protein [Halioglobus sp. HI00S01]KZX58022.1 hypothetical protein A3709_20640 [Halioglobus sp. HI00S01]
MNGTGFHLVHVALCGARIGAFAPYGYRTRAALQMKRVVPEWAPTIVESSDDEARAAFQDSLPIWINNVIQDPGFLCEDAQIRSQLEGVLRRFQGELKDLSNTFVVNKVLTEGYRDSDFDPLNMDAAEVSMRDRVAVICDSAEWQGAFSALEDGFLDILVASKQEISEWARSYQDNPETVAA